MFGIEICFVYQKPLKKKKEKKKERERQYTTIFGGW